MSEPSEEEYIMATQNDRIAALEAENKRLDHCLTLATNRQTEAESREFDALQKLVKAERERDEARERLRATSNELITLQGEMGLPTHGPYLSEVICGWKEEIAEKESDNATLRADLSEMEREKKAFGDVAERAKEEALRLAGENAELRTKLERQNSAIRFGGRIAEKQIEEVAELRAQVAGLAKALETALGHCYHWPDCGSRQNNGSCDCYMASLNAALARCQPASAADTQPEP